MVLIITDFEEPLNAKKTYLVWLFFLSSYFSLHPVNSWDPVKRMFSDQTSFRSTTDPSVAKILTFFIQQYVKFLFIALKATVGKIQRTNNWEEYCLFLSEKLRTSWLPFVLAEQYFTSLFTIECKGRMLAFCSFSLLADSFVHTVSFYFPAGCLIAVHRTSLEHLFLACYIRWRRWCLNHRCY